MDDDEFRIYKAGGVHTFKPGNAQEYAEALYTYFGIPIHKNKPGFPMGARFLLIFDFALGAPRLKWRQIIRCLNLLHRDGALVHRHRDFIVYEMIVESDLSRILLRACIINGIRSGPVDGPRHIGQGSRWYKSYSLLIGNPPGVYMLPLWLAPRHEPSGRSAR